MDKQKNIFISYSSNDQDKVGILKELIKIKNGLNPIVIADKREAQKPLTDKVIDGIEKSEIVVPIITSRSIHTQWMNQEIGYSLALSRKVTAIVERELLDDLKGFIHKQVDLPYNFSRSNNSDEENKGFESACILLVNDILFSKEKSMTLPNLADKHMNKIKEKVEREKLESEKERMLNSQEIVTIANQAVDNELLPYVHEQKDKWNQIIGKNVPYETSPNDPNGIILNLRGFALSFVWRQPHRNSIESAKLTVSLWDGRMSFIQFRYPIEDRPDIINEMKCQPYLDDELRFKWNNSTELMDSKQVVDVVFEWLAEVF
ncbi:MAG: toll/interleukin-1 receptor domain-containing protein [Bacteroidales bacterium]|nr:toll/interleukin-1 receptor domain-containing protein [Bacteroidales bacterium]